MLDGWYCRSIANMQANEASETNGAVPEPQEAIIPANDYSSDSSRRSSSGSESELNYRERYLIMKRSLKYLLYENECFQDALKCSQRRLLSASRDRTYLLDRLLMYEKGYSSSSESEDTESSDEGADYRRAEALKRKIKTEPGLCQGAPPPNRNAYVIKRKRPVVPKKPPNIGQVNQPGAHPAMVKMSPALGIGLSTDGHMTPEEVERHLQSRQSYLELLPERAPPTVPTEMFSNDPSLDSRRIPLVVSSSRLSKRSISESNDVLENSPNVEEWFD